MVPKKGARQQNMMLEAFSIVHHVSSFYISSQNIIKILCP